jgi:hypothetical protein
MPYTSDPSWRWARVTIIISAPMTQRFDWSRRQNQQLPQAGTNEAMTRSPTCTRLTALPTSSTVPAPS